MYAEFEALNGQALQTLVNEHGVELRAFPDDVLDELKQHSLAVVEQLASEDEWTGKAYASFKSYMAQVRPWTEIGERYVLNHR